MIDNINTKEMLASQMDRSGRMSAEKEGGFLGKLFDGFSNLISGGSLLAGNDELLIIDISYWQDDRLIDYELLSRNIDGVILRGTYGIAPDTRFEIHYNNFRKYGVRVGSYAYTIGSRTGKAQADAFYDVTKDFELRLGWWHDVEDQREGTRLTRAVADQFTYTMDSYLGMDIDIYTGVYAWRSIMGYNTAEYARRKLWVANYGVNSPRLPLNGSWDDFWLWQYSEHGRVAGYDRNLDMNRFRHDNKKYYDWIGGVDLPKDNEPLFKAKCVINSLRIRYGPSTSHKHIGNLIRNEEVEVFETSKVGSNVWYRIGVNRWACATWGSDVYMEKIDEDDPKPPSKLIEEFYWPCQERWPISQVFGVNKSWYPNTGGHNGVDWAIPVGNPIYAVADGKVIVARAETRGYGRHIRIEHPDGTITIYGHMSRNDVSVGDIVKAKQIIGLSGGAVSDPYSGMSTGPHLHFEIRRPRHVTVPNVPGSYLYNAIDPLPLLISHDVEDALFRAECITASLRVRTRPSTDQNSLIIGHLVKGQKVYVTEVSRNGWYRIWGDYWVSGREDYMKRLGDIQPAPGPMPQPEEPEPEEPPTDPNLKVLMSGHLRMREEPDLDARPVSNKYAFRGNEYKVYEISDNNWYLLDDGWISGNTQWTELIE